MAFEASEVTWKVLQNMNGFFALVALISLYAGFCWGYSLGQKNGLEAGYTHGYIEAMTGQHDPKYWKHVTFPVHWQIPDSTVVGFWLMPSSAVYVDTGER